MKTRRAISIGAGIWFLGVGAFLLSYSIPVMDNADQQGNLVLFLLVGPLVWFGSRIYYKTGSKTHGYLVGQTFLLTAAFLDALLTVPLLIIPAGGSHFEFFTDPGFWIIALEFLAVATAYYYIRVYPRTLKTL